MQCCGCKTKKEFIEFQEEQKSVFVDVAKFPRVCLHIQMLLLPCTNQSSPQNLSQTTYNEYNVYTFFQFLMKKQLVLGKLMKRKP